MSGFVQRYGPWALVTGASAGIGREFSRQLAQRGLSVVLVARRRAALEQLAAVLEREHGVKTQVLCADLTQPGDLARVVTETRNLDIGLVVNNAGAANLGPFLDHSLEAELGVVDLNVRATLAISHQLGARMVHRPHSGMLILSSLVGLLGVGSFANYAATKAFDLTLAEGLAAEWKGRIDVHAVLPGFTDSEYMDGMDMGGLPMPKAPTASMVSATLQRLGQRGVLIVPGFLNRLLAFITMRTPRWMNTLLMGAMIGRLRRKPPLSAAQRASS